jgi:hypothetical protein
LIARPVALVVATVAGVVAGTAHAQTARVVVPEKGEVIRLAGTGVECRWNTLARGVAFVSCGVADSRHRALGGSYSATLLDSGRVDVIAARSGKVVFTRTTASAAVAPRPSLVVGDALRVPRTSLVCRIVDADGPAAICFRADEKGARAQSYGFAVGRRVVLVMAYDGNRRPSSAGAWPQPSP